MTETEELTLLMLSEIHEHLDIKDSAVSPEPTFIKRAITTGNSWAILRKTQYPPEVAQVYDVLDMWRLIESSYKQLENPEREKVEAVAGGPPRIHGFDGNEDQLSIADFIIKDMGLYSDLKDRGNCDCHFSVRDKYRSMVATFKPIRARLTGGVGRSMTADEIIEVLTARLQP